MSIKPPFHQFAAATGVMSGLLALSVHHARAAAYQDAVIALHPTYYYQLNETSTAGGVIDSMGTAAPGTYNGDYVNGPPMVGGPGPLEVFGGLAVPGVGGAANLAHYSNNAGHILLGPAANYGANDMTVAFFMKAGPSQGGDRLFTNNLTDPTKSFQIDCGNDGLIIAVDPTATGLDAERTLYLEDNSDRDRRLINSGNGWFHVVASTHGATGPERASNFKVWINGVDRTANLMPDVVGWAVETNFAKIGGRGTDPNAPQTHSGAQDEMAIWLNRVLTDAEATALWTAAISTGPPAPFNIKTFSRDRVTGNVTIIFQSVANATYAVERSSNMTAWTDLTTTLQATGAETTYVDSSAEVHAGGRFFFRVRRL